MNVHLVSNSLSESEDRELFNRIAEKYYQKDLLQASRIARRHRLEQTINAISTSPNISILEVGCGAGFSVEYLKGKYSKYCGIDYSERLIEFAKNYHATPGIEFYATKVRDFKPEKMFDLIMLIGVLHHMKNIPDQMNHMINLLKPGGWLVSNEPHSGNRLFHLSRKLRKMFDPDYSSDQREFAIPELYNIFKEAGLENIRIHPQGVFSSLFAEVIMPFQGITALLSKGACKIDKLLEKNPSTYLSRMTWNVVIGGSRQLM